MQGGYGAGEQPSGPIKLTWRQGAAAPQVMGSDYEPTVAHGSTTYFCKLYNVYSYTVPENKWTKIPHCGYINFAIAVINDTLTTIGGRNSRGTSTNTLLSLSGSSWKKVLPPMPTKRVYPAAANTPTHLVVAGGKQGGDIATVEVLNTETLQWSTANNLPEAGRYPQMTTCSECLYLADNESNVFSCYGGRPPQVHQQWLCVDYAGQHSYPTVVQSSNTKRTCAGYWRRIKMVLAIQQEPFTAMMWPLTHGV